MDWEEARDACAKLGDGWRLPNSLELEKFYDRFNKNGKNHFKEGWYHDNKGSFTVMGNSGYAFIGKESGFPDIPNKAYVLPVRTVLSK